MGRAKPFRMPTTPITRVTSEVKQKRDMVLARLAVQHKTAEEIYRFLGCWEQTQALLDLLVEKRKIELVGGKYRPYGWKLAGRSGRAAYQEIRWEGIA